MHFFACEKAGVEIPKEVWKYFNNIPPNKNGKVVFYWPNSKGELNDAINWIQDETGPRFAVDLQKIPKEVRYINFRIY